jgi:hypothetical protein
MTNAACPTPDDVRRAVDAYNGEEGCGDEDAELWKDTARARELLLGSNESPDPPREVVEYTEAIRLWGDVVGVPRSAYPKGAGVLWGDPVRGRIRLLRSHTIVTASVDDIVDLEEAVVWGMRRSGVVRAEYSWASKMLHFLLPATMPVYDSRIRERLGTDDGIEGYRQIAEHERRCAIALASREAEIVGTIEPTTVLRALDKFYWREESQR